MKYAWTVVEHTGEQMTLVRGGEMLEIPRPVESSLRKVFMEIKVDESLADGIVWMLSGK
jgi:hypothetical protein